MVFEEGHIYHIYNQGNNRQRIFFSAGNYLFFLRKIKLYILPFADVLAWCLMPNHFHLMVYVRKTEIETGESEIGSATSSRTPTVGINKSIGIMLASYTRAINKQEKRTGSLFRAKTKSRCLNAFKGLSPSFYRTNAGTLINSANPKRTYSQVCFHYIHYNPVESGLAKKPEDWEFSSYRDYAGLRTGKIICRERAEEFGLKWADS